MVVQLCEGQFLGRKVPQPVKGLVRIHLSSGDGHQQALELVGGHATPATEARGAR